MKKEIPTRVIQNNERILIGHFATYNKCLDEIYSYKTKMFYFVDGYIDSQNHKVFVHACHSSLEYPSLETNIVKIDDDHFDLYMSIANKIYIL